MIASYPCYYLGVTKGMFQFHAWNNWAANHFWFAWSWSLSLSLFCFYDISASCSGALISVGYWVRKIAFVGIIWNQSKNGSIKGKIGQGFSSFLSFVLQFEKSSSSS